MKTTKHTILAVAMCLCGAFGAKAAYNGTPVTPQRISSVNYATYGFTADTYLAYENWYAISSAEELYGYAALVNNGATSANGVLIANIVVNENVLKSDGALNGTPTYSWTPIGTEANKFAGKFDGQGYSVSGLYFYNTTFSTYPSGGGRIGLFGYSQGASSNNKAEISNVGVIDSYFYGYFSIGSICGAAYDNTIISNCYNMGTIKGTYNMGGICGYTYCKGSASSPTIVNCYNTGFVSGPNKVGGVLGYSFTTKTITDCYYLEGCAVDGNGVVQNGMGNASTGRTTPDGGNMSSATEEELGEMIVQIIGENDSGGVIWIGDVITVYGDWVVTSNFVVPAGKTLNILDGASVTIIEGVELVNEGIVNNNGTIVANGTISGNNLAGPGQFIYNKLSNADVTMSATNYTYKGTAYTLENGINATINNRTFCGKQFTFDDTNYTVSYENNRNVGNNAKIKWVGTSTVEKTFAITAKTITVSATANNKVYDGTTTAAGTVTPSGIVNGDNVTVSYSSATFNDKNVGTGKPVTFNITKSGSDAGNYTVATTATTTANITAKTLTVSATANNKVYDGTTTAAGTVTPSGIVNGDNVTVSYSSATFNDKNVGTGKPVTFNITKSGSDAGNYTVATTATSAANITPNTNVTVTITGNSNTVTYNTEEHIISGYTVDIDDAIDVYTENDIAFIGMATVSGTIAGTYSMELSADDFSNTNTNFADVQFVVTDGVLTINKAENAPDMPTTIETYYINTQRVALPDNWQWVENIALEKGENTATAQYVGVDAGNYENESVDVVITRTACPHDEGYAIINTVEPSCTKEGYTGDHLCNICNEIFEQGASIEAHGHTNGEAVFENTVVATCTAAGSRESVVYCTVCQAEVSRNTLSIPALGHTEVVDAAVAATCTTVGKTEGKHCSVCYAVIVAQTEIAALGHKFENYIYNNDATTTADGTETATCEHGCGATDTRVAEGTLLPDDTFISESNTDQVNIYTIDNAIVVENATDEIFVYNAMGALVYKNSVYNVPVMISINRSGIYIVKTSGTVKRVMVN